MIKEFRVSEVYNFQTAHRGAARPNRRFAKKRFDGDGVVRR
jgi:hypothetical protein